MSNIQPNREQALVLKWVLEGKNVFFTGEAGTGKSAIISLLKKALTTKRKKYYVVAYTGLAATLIDASTLHSFLGLGYMKESLGVLKDKLSRAKKPTKDRWINTDTLIIDEVSMVRPDMFEKMDQLARFIRKKPDVFMGGMQIVISGDFAQCEPIYEPEERLESPDKCIWLFESPLFKQVFPWDSEKANNIVLLKQIYRQKDVKFQQLLSRIRLCRHTEEDLDFLYSRVIPPPDGKIRPVILRALRDDVDRINEEELRALEPNEDKWHPFEAKSRIYAVGAHKNERARYLLQQHEKSCQNPSSLQLAVGAQVLLTKNLAVADGLVNGSRGVVVDFKPLPGSTSSEDTKKSSSSSSSPILYPEVEFRNGARIVIAPEKDTIEENEEKLAERIQIPLRLAWALTIYKSQGMSLDFIVASLDSKVRGSGQAYVCISRVTGPEGLFIEKLDSSVFRIYVKVIEFYTTLEQIQERFWKKEEKKHDRDHDHDDDRHDPEPMSIAKLEKYAYQGTASSTANDAIHGTALKKRKTVERAESTGSSLKKAKATK